MIIRLSICFSLLLFTCKKPDIENIDSIENPTELIPVSGDEKYINSNSDYIFNQNKLHTFELNLSSTNLNQINENPTAEEYVSGSLTFDGDVYRLLLNDGQDPDYISTDDELCF